MEPALDNATLWWIAAALLVGAELLSGTFFLLMLSLGAMTAALLTYLGLPVSGQIAGAAIVSSLAALATFPVLVKLVLTGLGSGGTVGSELNGGIGLLAELPVGRLIGSDVVPSHRDLPNPSGGSISATGGEYFDGGGKTAGGAINIGMAAPRELPEL